MSLVNKLKLLIVLFCIVVSIPFMVKNIRIMALESLHHGPYLWLDEGFVVQPDLIAFENGYTGFRCLEGHTGHCYGGAGTFLDTTVLKIFAPPPSPVRTFVQPFGTRWPWLQKYAEHYSCLGITRIALALLLTLLLVTLCWKTDASLALCLGLCLISSSSFTQSWQGIKNDLSIGFFFFIFLIGARYLTSFKNFILTLALGVFGLGVKPILLPCLALTFPQYFFTQFRTPKIWLKTFLGFLFVIIFYLLLHPNTFASSSEAKWLYHFFQMSAESHYKDWPRFLNELKLFGFISWPIVFMLSLYFVSIKKFGFFSVIAHYGFYLATTFIFIFSTLKTSFGRGAYYFPILILILTQILLLAKDLKKVSHYFTALFALVTIFMQVPLSFSLEPMKLTLEKSHEEILDFLQKQPHTKNWLVDVVTRPPITQADLDSHSIQFFDSLSETPEDVLASAPDDAFILVSCWDPSYNPELSSSVQIPTTQKWGSILKNFCADVDPVTRPVVQSFINGYRSKKYITLPVKKLLPKLPTQDFHFLESKLYLRSLKGSIYGMDHWEMPFFFSSSQKLSGTFYFNQSKKEVHIPIRSNCKQDSTFSVKLLNIRNQLLSQKTISLNVSQDFCSQYPKLCKLNWFYNWAHPSYQRDVQITFEPQQSFKIEIDFVLPKDCKLIFSDQIGIL